MSARKSTSKHLRRQEKRAASKAVSPMEATDDNTVCPMFDIEYLLCEERYGMPVFDIPMAAAVFSKLKDFESMTVAEAKRNGKTLVKYPPNVIGKLCDYAAERLNSVDDYSVFFDDGIWRFELTGLMRVYAFRVNSRKFKVVWIDPNHEIYPTSRE